MAPTCSSIGSTGGDDRKSSGCSGTGGVLGAGVAADLKMSAKDLDDGPTYCSSLPLSFFCTCEIWVTLSSPHIIVQLKIKRLTIISAWNRNRIHL